MEVVWTGMRCWLDWNCWQARERGLPAALRLRLLEQRQAKHAEEFRARVGHDGRSDLIDGRTQQ